MMSSEGWSARQSRYSPNPSPSTNSSCETFMGLPASRAQVPIGLVADLLLIRLGDAQQHADDLHGHLLAEDVDDVEAVAADLRVEALRGELPDLGSSAATLGVNMRESRRRWIVCVGGSSKMTTPVGISISALMSSRIPPRPEMKVSRSR